MVWQELERVPARASGLRVPLTNFVGRDTETADVVNLLGKHRIVTVTGPGGVGKTRLAVEAAMRAADQFPDGIRFVELTAVHGNAQVAGQLMTALGVRERPGVPLAELLAEALAPRRMLLILDNCEHVLDAVAEVCGALLQAGDEVRILATGREQLWVIGEVRYRLSPLRLPAAGAPEETASHCDAVALFGDRARSADPRFSLSGGNAALASRVVERLDGMPLAIELAAARVEALGMSGLAQQLDDAIRLLAGPDRLAGGRHRSLTAVADWSYQLLTKHERRVFRQLAAFPGPFTLEAARSVAGSEAGAVVLRLVDCSLLVPPQPGGDGRTRYTLLETLRAFGTAQLRKAGEDHDTMAALCRFALSVAETATAGLETTDDEPPALRWLDAEGQTLTAALTWAEANDHAAAVRLAGALAPWWRLRGRMAEARARLESALRHASPADRGWAAAQVWLAHTLTDIMDWPNALDSFTVICEPANGADRTPWAVDAVLSRAVLKKNAGDIAGAHDDVRRARALARDLGCPQWEAPALALLTETAFYGGDAALALDRARQTEEALSGGVPGYLARWCLMTLTMVLTDAGEFDWASRACAAGLTLAREVGDLRALARMHMARARLELLMDNLPAARQDLREATTQAAEIADQLILMNCTYIGGFLCAATGRWADALTLWAAADTLAASRGIPDPGEDLFRPRRSEYQERIGRALSPGQISDARQRGTRMLANAAVEFISLLTEPDPRDPRDPPDRQEPAVAREWPGEAKLSARERELITLVAQGNTNAQIAARLGISAYTVRSHLDRIRDKTGCRRRADLTRLALRQGLV